ncbi:MAG: late competence development ComFB family protein [Clostridiales Family XIII bacterium]|jgi:competence protein ComFB|nr:late competence development ComFB family protein [Clostridiales Family XIII bacterium]
MANRKSNKTEHVMRLITKERKASAEGGDPEGKGAEGAEGIDASASLSSSEGELKYKAKLKIEIEPQLALKEADARPAGGIPDGVPFERGDDDIMGAVFASANRAREKMPETLEEVRASIKKDEEKRVKNIEFIEELLGFRWNLVNISELLTQEMMPSVMEKMGVCKCDLCASNVMALTLNALPPRYVTTDVGKQYSQLSLYKSQHELDLLQALTKACLKVKAFPRHDAGVEAAQGPAPAKSFGEDA